MNSNRYQSCLFYTPSTFGVLFTRRLFTSDVWTSFQMQAWLALQPKTHLKRRQHPPPHLHPRHVFSTVSLQKVRLSICRRMLYTLNWISQVGAILHRFRQGGGFGNLIYGVGETYCLHRMFEAPYQHPLYDWQCMYRKHISNGVISPVHLHWTSESIDRQSKRSGGIMGKTTVPPCI